MTDPPAPPASQSIRSKRLAVVGVIVVAVTLVVVVVAVIVAVARLGDDQDEDETIGVTTEVLVPNAAFPVAPMVASDGDVLYGERITGRVRRVGLDGALAPEPLAAFEVRSDGQRGLLGLVELADGALVVSYVRGADGRIAVERVGGGLVWLGPESADLANGGHLEVLPDGRLVIGIGDLQDRAALDDPEAPNGKLLALDPDGEPSQVPETLSSGWNNPFAFTVTGDGTIWVADNAPGEEPERLGRGDVDGREREGLDGQRAPSALAELPDGRLALCGFLSGRVELVDVTEDGPEIGPALSAPCTIGLALLPDGRLVTATETALHVVDDVAAP